MKRIELDIEKLTLRGVRPGLDREELVAAIETELNRLMERDGWPPGLDGGLEFSPPGELEITQGSTVTQIGSQIAAKLMVGWGQKND